MNPDRLEVARNGDYNKTEVCDSHEASILGAGIFPLNI
jgi:hypothetical protein